MVSGGSWAISTSPFWKKENKINPKSCIPMIVLMPSMSGKELPFKQSYPIPVVKGLSENEIANRILLKSGAIL
jgi:hypothetical protein